MKPVKAPLKVGDRGPEVTNLQDALQFLIERRTIQMPDSNSTSLLERLQRDREQEFYSDGGTYPVIQLFQKQYELSVTGSVDEATAAKLNELLRGLGAFDETALTKFVVHGHVRYANGQPAAQVTLFAYDKDFRSEEPLGQVLTDSEGSYAIRYSPEGAPVQLSWAAVDGSAVQITVRDHGPGFDADLLPHAFEPGVRGNAAPGALDGGAGLGLTIAKRLLEHQHATLAAENPSDGGAEVRLTLHRAPSAKLTSRPR